MKRLTILLPVLFLTGCETLPLLVFHDQEKYLQESLALSAAAFDANPCFATPAPGSLPPVDPPQPTRTIWVSGTLSTAHYKSLRAPVVIFNEQGEAHCVSVLFSHLEGNQWEWRIEEDDHTMVWPSEDNPPARLVFDEKGLLVDFTPSTPPGQYKTGAYSLGWREPCKSYDNVVTLGLKEQDARGLIHNPGDLMLFSLWGDEARTQPLTSCLAPTSSETLVEEVVIAE